MLECYVCNVPLGESSNVLVVEGRRLHYTCAFRVVINKVYKEKKNDSDINISK